MKRGLVVLGIETSCDETGVAIIRASAAPGLPPGLGVQAEILAQALHSVEQPAERVSFAPARRAS